MLRKEIGCFFELKESSIGPPKIYLSGCTCKVVLENGVEAWGFSLSQYVQEAVKNVDRHLARKDRKLPARAGSPMQTSYRPELDVTKELDHRDASYYQSLIVFYIGWSSWDMSTCVWKCHFSCLILHYLTKDIYNNCTISLDT